MRKQMKLMINMKKIFSIILCICITSFLCACGQEPEIKEEVVANEIIVPERAGINLANYPSAIVPGIKIEAKPELYSEIDLSEPYTVNMLLLGYTPNDWDVVLSKINEYLKPYNTDLNVSFVSWAEFQNLYCNELHSGDYDLAFTAPWAFMYSEAAKGSFYTLDTRFASSYMPLTYKYQATESWDETTIFGTTVAVPSNMMSVNGKIVAIRQDIADELGIERLKNWDDYMNYMLAVASEITPETGVYAMAAAGENKELWDQYRQQFDTFYSLESDWVKMMYQYDGEIPEIEDISLMYETDMFKNFCLEMRKLYEAGAWSKDAILNSELTDDMAFGELQGASISWNKSIFTYIEQAEMNDGVKCSVYFLTPNNLVASEDYSNNDMAIMAASKNPERAAMLLDIMKCDTYVNHLLRLGVENVHYTIDEEGVFNATNKTTDYPFDYISAAWAIRNADLIDNSMDKREAFILEEEEKCKVQCPTVTFVFDDSNVATQMQQVNKVLTEYVPRLQLGMYSDVEASISKMLSSCYEAGMQDIIDEYQSQYNDWYATR